MTATLIDPIESIDEYINKQDWRTKENANQTYSLSGLSSQLSGKVTANYFLDKIYTPEEGQAHREGKLHYHDLSILGIYCCGFSLRQLIEEGFGGVEGKVSAKPPKHLDTCMGQMVNAMFTLSQEIAGAVAYSDIDLYLAPFIREDNLTDQDIRQAIQQFIFSCNVPSRGGSQPSFTNVSMALKVPEDMKDDNPIIGGEVLDYTYSELQDEMDRFNYIFFDVLEGGGPRGEVFTFPIPSVSITEDFDWDSKVSEKLFSMTAKYGLPYFQNYIGSNLKPNSVRSFCCRLQLDLEALEEHSSTGLFGAVENTGSVAVCTINMARLGYLHKDDYTGLIKELDHLLDLAADGITRRRRMAEDLMERGLYPYLSHALSGTLENHFSTIGINGMNELVRNYTHDAEDITTESGEEIAFQIISHIKDRMLEFQKKYGDLYNLEYTPSEGATTRFALRDREQYPDIIQAGTKTSPYYTNSAMTPVGFTDDIFEAMDVNERLQTLASGGTVFHIYCNDSIKTGVQAKQMIKAACENYKIPFFSITPTFSTCEEHGYILGDVEECPTCHGEVTVWIRVMGYFRPVKSFNKGKTSEYNERTYYDLSA